MAEDKARLQNSTSPLALLHEAGHKFQVARDGLHAGVHGLLASVIGLPRDLYEFAAERVKGTKSATPEEERIMSSAWLEKLLDENYTAQQRLLGMPRPEIREGTSDRLIHIGAQFIPAVASFFIPGVGEAKLASMGSKLGKTGEAAGRFAGKLGTQLSAADLATIGVEYGEKWAGIERPVETASARDANGIVSKARPASDFVKAGGITSPKKTDSAQDIAILGYIIDGHLRHKENSAFFDEIQLKNLQSLLVGAKYLQPTAHNPNPTDGLIGKETVRAIDLSVKQFVRPESVTGDVKESHIKRMKEIARELTDHPSDSYNFDPRVLELQVSAYALGLYNKNIDGLAGTATLEAISKLGSLQSNEKSANAISVKFGAKTPEVSPG